MGLGLGFSILHAWATLALFFKVILHFLGALLPADPYSSFYGKDGLLAAALTHTCPNPVTLSGCVCAWRGQESKRAAHNVCCQTL